ncbi:hypothetical protein VRU48_09025 [Pedobacter sp. KR3-3]|uniref:Lipoprotein n=1 Tax=Pedobacter albus TaxID=3113905 RepID=A0ABU7I7N9_9SPHI|nr:hypothetical protein [Pedobacter sp. KR3-3]MEE1945249.1 hypothetical protein [Pedobacter sp. KR3-3]
MKKLLQYGLALTAMAILFLGQTGCQSFSGSGEKGEVVSNSQFQELKKQKTSDGKRVAVMGRVTVANSNLTLKMGSPTSMTVDDQEGKLIDFFDLYHGKGKNEFFLPADFTPKDLKLYDNDGKPHNYDEIVQLSFTMKRVTEVRPEQDPLTGAYVWKYEQLRIDPVK